MLGCLPLAKHGLLPLHHRQNIWPTLLMAFTILALLGLYLIARASSNIVFHWTQPTCRPSARYWSGCLSGQHCLPGGTCTCSHGLIKRQYSPDGRCGPLNGDLLCDPNSSVYNGTCCSEYGWCGSTDAHCGFGCASGCTATSVHSFNVVPTAPQFSTASSTFDILPTYHSSSQSAANGEASIAPMATVGSQGPPSPTASVTTDGTCGAAYDGMVCGNWSMGSCCSMYGFCGNT